MLWFRGTYASYTSFSAAIVGLFTTPVPTNATPANTNPPITYVDATSGPSGNTTLANGSIFAPPLNGVTGADNNWEERTGFASGGNVFEAGGETSENAPELSTTISGLVPGATYAIQVFFWDATGSTENWNIRAGFTSAPGANPLFSAADSAVTLGATAAVLANTLNYKSAPTIFLEGNRVLLAASLGTSTADGSGAIRVFVDDKPTTVGANNRTWYDGLGWALAPAAYPTNLSFSIAGDALTVSWPISHLGWILQSQTNDAGLLSNAGAWFDWPGSEAVTSTNIMIHKADPPRFFRLRSP